MASSFTASCVDAASGALTLQCETHVAHHLCSAIPHYNAWEATEALKEKLGSYYLYDDRNLFLTLFRSAWTLRSRLD